ncbi:MAG: glycosyltransferase family 2 protein [Methylovulum sp.]|nr:glycosyltransferase family 2 protein [Methylovulum sp.]
MNLYGILIAKDEGDIIEQTLLSLRQFGGFKKIFFYDNGSSDNTAEIAKKFNDIVASVNIINQPYSDSLKYQLLYKHKEEYQLGDWLAILDADELYAEQVLDKIVAAEKEGSNYIESRSAQFYFTEHDEYYNFFPHIPIIEQRQHYLVNYGEPRIFKYLPNIELTEFKVKSRFSALKPSSEKLLVNHFQYRSVKQTQHRIDIRIANDSSSHNWGHIKDRNWKNYLVNSNWLHRFDRNHIFGLPINTNLYKIPNNCAYTGASLKWMSANNYLTEQQNAFFTASRLERILRKVF